MAVPKYDDLFNPVLSALHALGGSGRVDEIDEKTATILELSEDDVNEIHKGNTTVLSYRAAWARNYLKRYGLLENSEHGVWALTSEGRKKHEVNKTEVKRFVKAQDKTKSATKRVEEDDFEAQNEWQEKLLEVVKAISPDAFERLCQRLLRELGATEVTVEGRSGDGGIDGRGIFQINPVLSMRVIFQAKRYRGSVSSQQIREFKGTMAGRAEKGVFITTGTFTRDAKREAVRDGSPPIELVDGLELASLLKSFKLGMSITLVEKIEINTDWFKEL